MLPLYSLTTTARLVGLHPRTIMNYEKEGLVKAARTPRNQRLFSNEDLKTLLLLKYLRQEEKLNLPAIKLLFKKNLLNSVFSGFDASQRLREILGEI